MRRRASEKLKKLRDEGATIDESWHRTHDLKSWRTSVDSALLAVGPGKADLIARFRAVRWVDDDPTLSEIAALEAFHLGVEDTLSVLASAIETAENAPGSDGMRLWPWLTAAAIAAMAIAGAKYVRQPPQISAPPASVPASARFKIMQISDLSRIEGLERGMYGGLARVRSLRKHLESEELPVLIVNAGDTLSQSVMRKYVGGAPMITTLNLLDGASGRFDHSMVATFGNHDFDGPTDGQLFEVLRSAEFHWVSTNVESCRDKDCKPFSSILQKVESTALLDVGGTKVGVIGLLYPMERSFMRTSTKTPEQMIAVAKQAAASLRARGARVIIALTHQEWADDLHLAEKVADVDVVIGGLDRLYQAQRVGRRWVSKPDADARSVVVYDVTVPSQGRPTMTPLRVVMDATTPLDPTVDAEIQRWRFRLGRMLGAYETFGQTKVLLEGTATAIRSRETSLGNLLADIIRDKMQTEIAVLNGSAIRIHDDIPPGPITNEDVEGIFYYNNDLVSFSMTGKMILDMLNNSVSRVDFGDGRFLQVSGLSFGYRNKGNRYVVGADDVRIGGKPLDPERAYTVGTIDYLYIRGADDGYMFTSEATRPPMIRREADFRRIAETYLREHVPAGAPIEGRIVRAP